MNFRRILSNLSVAFVAQGVSLLLSVALTLLVPKVLGVEEFGYWQLFIFYAGYVGLFHLGLNDGVYLLHGGEEYAQMDKRDVGSQFRFGVAIQSVIALIIVFIAMLAPFESNRIFVIVAIAIYMVLSNATLYLGYVFQAANETKLFSISVILDRAAFLAATIFLVLFSVKSFAPYVVLYVFAKAIALAFCCYKGKEIVLSRQLRAKDTFASCGISVRVGIKLMLANIAGMFIVGVMRLLVDSAWGIETFGQLSLALSLENFFLLFIQQVGMVLFPVLRQTDEESQRAFFAVLEDGLSLVMPITFVLYYPIALLLGLWLPAYADALRYFGILLPICIFDSRMSLISVTYMKVLRKEKMLLAVNAGAVMLSAVFSVIGVYCIGQIEATIVLVVVVLALRSIASEMYLAHALGCSSNRAILTVILSVVVFLACNAYFEAPVAFVCVSGFYGLLLLANTKTFKEIRVGLKDLGERK